MIVCARGIWENLIDQIWRGGYTCRRGQREMAIQVQTQTEYIKAISEIAAAMLLARAEFFERLSNLKQAPTFGNGIVN